MLERLRSWSAFAGFAGALILLSASLVVAFAYTGANGERYSPLNYVVSELGHTASSTLAPLMNLAFILSGICFAVFIIGATHRFNAIPRGVISITGVIMGIFASLVGVFPMNIDRPIHVSVAGVFFLGGLFTVTAFSLVVLLSKKQPYPRWLGLLGIPHIIFSLIFINILRTEGTSALSVVAGIRADFRLVTVSEWGIVIALMTWVSVTSLLMKQNREQP